MFIGGIVVMLSDMLNLTCTVQQVADSQNNMGGPIKTFSTRIADAECSLKQRSQNTTDAYGKPTTQIVYRFYFEATATNRAMITSDRIVYNSRTFEIDVIYDVAGMNEVLQVDCTEVV